MTDKELLEMAAKAAGIKIEFYEDACIGYCCGDDGRDWPWNPLADDGDALRLAVKLGLNVFTYGCNTPHPFAIVVADDDGIEIEEQPDFGDGFSATRRAIVRAAAEIGKAME